MCGQSLPPLTPEQLDRLNAELARQRQAATDYWHPPAEPELPKLPILLPVTPAERLAGDSVLTARMRDAEAAT